MRVKRSDFKPLLIQINKEAQNEYNLRVNALKTIIIDFFNECELYINTPDKNEFKENAFNKFKELFAEKYSSEFPSIVSIDKQLEMSNVQVNKLAFLSEKLKDFKDIEIDYNTYETPVIDFGIYTSDENQNKLLIFAKSLIDKINESEQFVSIQKGHIIQGFNNLLSYDHNINSFVPNYYFLTNQIR